MFTRIIKKIKLKKMLKNGLIIGKNFNFEKGVILDPSIPWLIKIGNNVTLAPYVHILAHDASTKILLNYTKIGKVEIGDNVFIGSKSIVLPNVKIGNDVIVAAGSVVTKDISDGVVVAGNPAKVISTTKEFILKHKSSLNESTSFKRKKVGNKKAIPKKMKKEIINELNQEKKIFYID